MSLRCISNSLRIAKSTIYYHTRKKFGRRYVEMIIDYKPTPGLGEFLGLFASDGCFYVDRKRYQYTLTISLSSYQLRYAEIVSEIMRGIFSKSPRIDKKRKIVQIVMRGKSILAFLRRYLYWTGRRTYTIHFKSRVLAMKRPFLRGILRGLISGDGGVYVAGRRVTFGVVSRRLAQQCLDLLEKFGIPSRWYAERYRRKKTLYQVTVTGKANLEKFKLRVGLTDPAKRQQLEQALRR